MSTISSRASRRKPGGVESTRVDGNARPVPPGWLEPKPNPGDMELLDELIESGATMAVVKVFRFLGRACVRYRQPGTWVFQSTIAKATGLGKSTVRVALHWLENGGWIARTAELVAGEAREMAWCLWLLPSGKLDDARVDLGHGVWSRGPDRSKPRRSAPRVGADFRPPGADACAQGTAPEYSKRTGFEESTLTLTRPSPGGEEAEEPPSPAPIVPAAPDPLPAARVAELVGVVRSHQKDFLRKVAYWELELAGQLPADLVGLFKPPAPESNPARPSGVVVPPVPPPASVPDVEALMRRLAQPQDEAGLIALCDELADRMARSLCDPGWRNCFRKRALLTGRGRLQLKPLIRSYVAARKSDGETKGRLMIDLHNKAIGHQGGPIEGFLAEARGGAWKTLPCASAKSHGRADVREPFLTS